MVSLSIKSRLVVMAGACLLATSVTLVGMGIHTGVKNAGLVKTDTVKILEANSIQILTAEAELQASNVQKNFTPGYQAGLDLSSVAMEFRNLARDGLIEPTAIRAQLAGLTKNWLLSHPELLSLYIVFDPNALDGKDAHFVGRHDLGSNERGRFSIYAAQQDGGVITQPTSEALISDETPMLDGTPFNTWFNCPRSSSKPCLLSPYFDESSGRKTLITTISFPLIDKGKVIGVVGMDISLESIQSLVVAGSRKLFGGAGSVKVVTPTGLLAGNSDDGGKLGGKVDFSQGMGFIDGERAASGQSSGVFRAAADVQPFPGSVAWKVVVDVPRDVVMQPASRLQARLDQRTHEDNLWTVFWGCLTALAGLTAVFIIARRIVLPIEDVSKMLRDIGGDDGDLTRRLLHDRQDELGSLVAGFNTFLDKLQPMMAHLQKLVGDAHDNARQSSIIASAIHSDMQQQLQEVEQAATASNQMSTSAQEVAVSASLTADAARDASTAAHRGQGVVEAATVEMQRLASAIDDAMVEIDVLSTSSERIGSVLSVITAVADQTNLLALNAAIEAARAGEAGRGFAVVADEVRRLAKSTRQSTAEIRVVVEELQSNSRETVAAMRRGAAFAGAALKNSTNATEAFGQIRSAVGVITDMTVQIAAASEEQSRVADEVSRNAAAIRDVTESLTIQASHSQIVSSAISSLAARQQALAAKFRT